MASKFNPCVIVRSPACQSAEAEINKVKEVARKCFSMLESGKKARDVVIEGVRTVYNKPIYICEEHFKKRSRRRPQYQPYQKGAVVAADIYGGFSAASTAPESRFPNYFSLGTLQDSKLGAVSVASDEYTIRSRILTSTILNLQENSAICQLLNKVAAESYCPVGAIMIDGNRVPHIFNINAEMVWTYITPSACKSGFEKDKCISGATDVQS